MHGHKSPFPDIASGVVQASLITNVFRQEESQALDMLELLMDISSSLQATEYYIQTMEKTEKAAQTTAAPLSSEEDIPYTRRSCRTSHMRCHTDVQD